MKKVHFFYTMTIVFASLMVVIIVGILGALMVQMAPQKIEKFTPHG